MTHRYQVAGMTCAGCVAKVKGLLEKVAGVTAVQIDLTDGKADVTMSHHVPTTDLQQALVPPEKR